jgi:hypothetical protein
VPNRPLALIAGRIREHPDAGSYPLLRVVAGRLRAGGAGNNVYLLSGRFVEVKDDAPYVAPGYWSDGYADGYVNEGYVTGGYVGQVAATPEPTPEPTVPPANRYVADGYVAGGYVTA